VITEIAEDLHDFRSDSWWDDHDAKEEWVENRISRKYPGT